MVRPSKSKYIFVSSALLACVACGDSAPPLEDGALQLSWQVSPRGCDESGVTHVEISVDGPDSRTEVFSCSALQASIEGLTVGKYHVLLNGLDDEGRNIFTSPETRKTVKSDYVTTVAHTRLTAKPAEIQVQWRFDNGRVCGANEVTEIEAVVFDKLDYEIARDTFKCDTGIGQLEGFTAGTYVIEAVTVGTGTRFQGIQTVSVDRGDVGEIEIVLNVAE